MPGLHQPVTTRQAFLPLVMLVGLTLCICRSQDANGQGLNAKTNEIGVRHTIIAAVEANRDAASAKGDGEALNATVDILVRILNYAPDYRFYGVVDGKFSDFDPSKGTAAREIWADRKCHQNRGLPIIWVLAINGRVTRDDASVDIAARRRHIGEWLPSDEIVMQKPRSLRLSDPNQSLAMLARTTQSRLSVRLTLNSTKCRLNED